jgi:hypothetical protein
MFLDCAAKPVGAAEHGNVVDRFPAGSSQMIPTVRRPISAFRRNQPRKRWRFQSAHEERFLFPAEHSASKLRQKMMGKRRAM